MQYNLRTYSRELRNNSTLAEIKLWNEFLKGRKCKGLLWNRQFVINNYIVDFICRKQKLIIEIDGYSHNFKYKKDVIRDKTLSSLGYRVIRFTEKEVICNFINVITSIEAYCNQSPNPLRQGGMTSK